MARGDGFDSEQSGIVRDSKRQKKIKNKIKRKVTGGNGEKFIALRMTLSKHVKKRHKKKVFHIIKHYV